ncbi:MAG: putative oxidoreductase [Candidatus Marinimicrobia bacterium]|nr:putative oxidoreductase [Candidatus Neomarinimicrobiota bacterium]
MKTLHIQGADIPALGIGTWQMHGSTCRKSVLKALEIGYRHVDTAQMYRNEEEVGKAIRESDISRDDIFLTTKVVQSNLAPSDVLSSTRASLDRLESEYIDLLLIHWPSSTVPIPDSIQAMNELQEEGVVKHIGVSNFSVAEMQEALNASETPIITNQVEFYPSRTRGAILDFCQENDLMLTAYSPLGKGRIIGHPTLEDIGEKYGKSSAQVALHWLIQQLNVSVIPKASTDQHIRENFDIFDFELSEKEMKIVASL